MKEEKFIENLTACRKDYDSKQFKQDRQDLDDLLNSKIEECAVIIDSFAILTNEKQKIYVENIAKKVRESKQN